MKKLCGAKALLILFVVAFGAMGTAVAGPIISAVSANINSGGPGFGSINDTFNQNGLAAGYTSGVTDFDTYVGSGVLHTLVFVGNEWFSNLGSNSASVTYNLGAATVIDALALWNEDFSGIGVLDLFTSLDGVSFTALALGLLPADIINVTDYAAEVFNFAAVNAQYIRFDMSGCPQDPSSFDSCAIGEVAFREGEQPVSVPEPASLALLALGLIGLGFSRRMKAA